MKTKFSLVSAALVAGSLSLVLCSTAVAQMYGQKPPQGSAPAGSPGASPGAKKPGDIEPGGVIVATPITKEEAEKKDPPPKSGYPTGDRPYSHVPGHILSPYSPHVEYDCSQIAHGALVLDTRTNHVFVRP